MIHPGLSVPEAGTFCLWMEGNGQAQPVRFRLVEYVAALPEKLRQAVVQGFMLRLGQAGVLLQNRCRRRLGLVQQTQVSC